MPESYKKRNEKATLNMFWPHGEKIPTAKNFFFQTKMASLEKMYFGGFVKAKYKFF